jgi:hypothetical protein
VVLAGEGETAPELRVALTELSDRVRAEIVATDTDGRETQRTLFAANCREAVEGSAWIAAVWLDPSLLPPAEAAPVSAPLVTTSAPAGLAHDQPPSPSDRSASSATSPAPRAASVRLEAGVQTGSFMTALPETPLGFSVFLAVSAWQASVFAPVLRWGYVAAGTGRSETERGDVLVSLGTMRGLGCVFAWKASPLTLRPCALFELGSLKGRGDNTTQAATETIAWRSLGILARAELRAFPWLSVDAEAGAVFPLSRDRFVFGPEPATVGFAPPVVTATLSLGLSVGGPISGSD